MFIFRALVFIYAVINTVFITAAESNPITEIDSVRQIKVAFDSKNLFVVDADETVSKVDFMPFNWECHRQYKKETMAAALAFYESKVDKYKVDATDTVDAFFAPLRQVFASQPISYSLTEEVWPGFLASVRSAGAQVIVVSSRGFEDEEPARIEFFKSLGFKRNELLYARGKKDVTIHEWLADKPSIEQIIFIDNLKEHCTEVAESLLLQSYERTTFVHNAYKDYFGKHHKILLPLQLEAAYSEKRRLTDREAMASGGALLK